DTQENVSPTRPQEIAGKAGKAGTTRHDCSCILSRTWHNGAAFPMVVNAMDGLPSPPLQVEAFLTAVQAQLLFGDEVGKGYTQTQLNPAVFVDRIRAQIAEACDTGTGEAGVTTLREPLNTKCSRKRIYVPETARYFEGVHVP
ncbi:MAG: hypothetical protein KC587_18095, partial [Nitrospira sp.]|nr:hypothetical protein [Nitrospira sp.]